MNSTRRWTSSATNCTKISRRTSAATPTTTTSVATSTAHPQAAKRSPTAASSSTAPFPACCTKKASRKPPFRTSILANCSFQQLSYHPIRMVLLRGSTTVHSDSGVHRGES
ncbi:unknown (plasmid) [Halobacterium salinarum NRC-1]|uniref:Spurious ORF n=1 Tax=Halobacterium salinarum (strain ATCC 700922 / JCM 11081 / NRC-1) TaxID=64091 RepID=O51992_HALSA|nr:unknown [Halobacterium salinarum NRC-1]DAC79573.1 TPA_inf: spurious ORF [Halobacterium salinarum NRC-1]